MISSRLEEAVVATEFDWAASEPIRATNPFATRWVRPGAIPYCFPENQSSETIVEQLQQHGWRGAIIGPHGSGKSTLLATLIPTIEQASRRVCFISLHDGQRALPRNAMPHLLCGASEVVIVDGYEQLSWWAKFKLLARCQGEHWGLLVTGHRKSSTGRLPVVYKSAADLATVENLVNRLLPDHHGWIHSADIATAFTQHAGNVRDTLFTLYHLFEQRRAGCCDSARQVESPPLAADFTITAFTL